MIEQTAEDRARRVLRVTLGTVPVVMSDLSMRASAKWLGQLQVALTALGDAVPDEHATATLFDLAGLLDSTAVDLIMAFDALGEGALASRGGRDWIMDNASPTQIRETLDTLREVSIPFGADAEAMTLTRLLVRAAALNVQNSMSGPSPTGGSIPTPSRPRSQRRNSPTSGSRARNASGARPVSA